MAFIQFDQGIQIREGFLGGIGDVPDERNFGMFARRLKEDLVISAIIDVQHEEGGFFIANWERLHLGFRRNS
jgi:hypothetical protein